MTLAAAAGDGYGSETHVVLLNVGSLLDSVADILHAEAGEGSRSVRDMVALRHGLARHDSRDGPRHGNLGRSARGLAHFGFGGPVVQVLVGVGAALGRVALVLDHAAMIVKRRALKRVLATDERYRGGNMSYGQKALITVYLTTLMRFFAGVSFGGISQARFRLVALATPEIKTM